MGPITRLIALLGLAFLIATPIASAQTPEPGGAGVVADTEELSLDGRSPVLSPDGEHIAFLRARNAFCILEISSGDESCTDEEEQPLPVDPGSILWAPDSSKVAFSLNAALLLVDSDIYVMDADSGELTDLTDDGEDRRLELSGDDIDVDTYPAWSPDSATIVFARTNLGRGDGTSLMTIPVDGGEPEVVEGTQVETPFAVNAQIFWTESDALYYSVWAGNPDEKDHGIWRWQDGETEQILRGTEGDDYPYAELTSITADEKFAIGYSPALISQTSFDPDLSRVFAMDLATGETVPADADLLDDPATEQMLYPPRISANGQGLVWGVLNPNEGTVSIRIAVIDIAEEPREILEVSAEGVDEVAIAQGLTWAANDTVLVPTSANEGAILVTLDPGIEATPIAPCSCTPPDDATPDA